ncbi:MAG: leucyl/phenylalanyl-tRNA--protein transferase [Chitinophagales bacterium]
MPIYQLNETNLFPPVNHAEEGIIAIGGDLSTERLIAAYQSGIFPWYSKDEPIIWWAPDPRFVLFPKKIKISKSMKQLFNKEAFTVTFDADFKNVIKECAIQKREGQPGTWITDEMLNAYINLHDHGLAHSVEVWSKETETPQLIGGLYGVSLGNAFFGESMFHKRSNTSKYGFITLVQQLIKRNFQLIDCQMETPHLKSLGAELITRNEFMNRLESCLQEDTFVGKWSDWLL